MILNPKIFEFVVFSVQAYSHFVVSPILSLPNDRVSKLSLVSRHFSVNFVLRFRYHREVEDDDQLPYSQPINSIIFILPQGVGKSCLTR